MNRYSKILTQSKKNGAAQAMLYALPNINKETITRPHIGIGSMWYESNPCNCNLDKIASFVKSSITDSNLVGFKFATPGVSDGQSMGTPGMRYSLLSRDWISDNIEMITNAHYYDGLILIPGCDKNLPGSFMGLCKVNRPGFLMYGGSMPSSNYNGQKLDIVSAFESYGKYISNEIDDDARENIIQNSCSKKCGSCSGLYTANTMASLIEVMGMSLPNTSTNPSDLKMKESASAGKIMYNLLKEDLKPSDILTKKSFINGIKLLNIMGGSTNGVIHLLAMAKSANIDLTLHDFVEYQNLPVLTNMKPHGEYVMNDLYKNGFNMGNIINYLIEENILDGECMTITGKKLKDNYINLNYDIKLFNNIIKPINKPFKKTSHIRILKGNLAPDGCVSKIYCEENNYSGKVIVFDTEEDMIDALKDDLITKNHFVVIRYQGETTGCPEMLSPTSALVGYFGYENVPPLATDGRFSGGSRGILIAHLPDAYKGNITSILKNNDIIKIDIEKNLIEINISEENINERLKLYNKQKFESKGILNKYSRLTSGLEYGYSC
tara:strand:+ start:492 stop:2144 length:1653 start_codon:yes stop_codon:yes gene_type:complete